jgi:hypothetical protein
MFAIPEMSSGEVILMPNSFIDRKNHFYKKLYNFITNLKELDNFKDINFLLNYIIWKNK